MNIYSHRECVCVYVCASVVTQFDNLILSDRLTAAVSFIYCIMAHTEMTAPSAAAWNGGSIQSSSDGVDASECLKKKGTEAIQ